MKKAQGEWLDAALIVLVTLVTFGVLIPQLGFYRDDWYLFSTAQSQGSAGVIALFNIDRPLVGYFYVLGMKILGMAPLAWQIAALPLRLFFAGRDDDPGGRRAPAGLGLARGPRPGSGDPAR